MNGVFLAIGALLPICLAGGALLGYAAVRFRVQGDPVAEQVNALLPQTQCGQCGYPGCKPYAEAIAAVNDFAFGPLGLDQFDVCNVATNAASRRVKQKTGAEFVGFVELPHHNGETRSEKWVVRRETWLRRSQP